MTTFYQSFCFFVYDIRHFHVVFCGLIKGRSNHFGIHRTCHIGHLLWTLIDEQNDHIHLWMVLRNSIGYLLEQHGLTCLRLCHDQTTLSLANGGKEVDDTYRQRITLVAFAQLELLVWEQWGQVLKCDTLFGYLWCNAIHAQYLFHWEVLVCLFRWTNSTFHRVACLQTILTYLLLRYVDVVWRRNIVVVGAAQESVAIRRTFQGANSGDGIAKRLQSLVQCLFFWRQGDLRLWHFVDRRYLFAVGDLLLAFRYLLGDLGDTCMDTCFLLLCCLLVLHRFAIFLSL